MKKNRHKILVFSDLKKSTSTVLKSTVSLTKMVDGDIMIAKSNNALKPNNPLSLGVLNNFD